MKSNILFTALFIASLQEATSFAARSNPPSSSGTSSGTKKNFSKAKSKSTENKRQGYLKRSAGIKTKRKKPPKWEKEGDSLFFLHQSGINDQDAIKNEFSSPRQLLENKFSSDNANVYLDTKENKNDSALHEEEIKSTTPNRSPFMWGGLSAGPIMSPKLNALFPDPTPIQSKAFDVLSKSKKGSNPNVVIASPTGSGKTLSYLLPLLASTKRDAFGRILIATPTQDLAYQIQRVVDQLWDPINNYSGMYIVQPPQGDDINQIQSWTVAEMKLCKSPIIAGTPKSLSTLVSYCRRTKAGIFDNLSTIVLDEADRLLQTELVARGEKEYQKNSLTEQLIDEMKKMGVSFEKSKGDSARLVCVSATIGRTIRRQMMEMTGSSSIDKAATLITADDRTVKDETKRRNSLLPSTIQHQYALYEDEKQLVKSIWETMKNLSPAPTLVFPGKKGVVAMVEELQAFNLGNVNTLRDEVHWDESAEENSSEIESWSSAPIFVVGEKFARGLDIPNVKYVFLTAPPTSPAAYAHLAGRTGRGVGNKGDAITLVREMKEAIRLVSLAGALGLTFAPASNMYDSSSDIHPSDDDVKITKPEDSEEKPDLGALSVIELKDLLREKGLKVSGRKAELIERLQS